MKSAFVSIRGVQLLIVALLCEVAVANAGAGNTLKVDLRPGGATDLRCGPGQRDGILANDWCEKPTGQAKK